jgi:hypothetical protein
VGGQAADVVNAATSYHETHVRARYRLLWHSYGMALPNPERENLTWEMYHEACRTLAQRIADDDFVPDIILAIARGGLFAAGSLG